MNQLPLSRRVQVLSALVEGCSIRSTVRMTGAAKNTIVKLLVNAGRACAEYQHNAMRNLTCKRLQLDEIWSFCYAKEKNVPSELRGQPGYGDVWTFVAIDAETKIVPSWLVGLRDGCHATAFVQDLASRLTHRVEILVQFGPTWRPKSSSKTDPPSATACKLVHCNNAAPATGGGGWSTWKSTHAFDKPIAKST